MEVTTCDRIVLTIGIGAGMFSLFTMIICISIDSSHIQADLKKTERGFFWHVSDFHYDDSYGKEGQSCSLPVSDPGPFGSGACDAPLRLIEDSIKAMAAIKPDVDFILWTGDNSGHIPTPEFSMKRNLYMINTTTAAVKRTFPNTIVVPTFGNHEFYPADYTNGTEKKFYDAVCKMWASWIKDRQQIESCTNGGFYSRLVGPKLRVLAVNTILYLIENPKVKNLSDPAQQFEWLEANLVAARQAGEKVIVTAHVAPTIPAPSVFHWFYLQYHGRYVDLMMQFSDVIVAHHYGHEHSDAFKILQRKDETRASAVFLSPSVTPLRGLNPKKGELNPRHNPGVRLVQYDRRTGRHLNYRQFYTNITEDNRHGDSNWNELYNFQDAYNVSDMSVTSLREIYDKMAQPFSTTMLQYCSFFRVSPASVADCSLQDQAGFWCGGQMTDLNKTNQCIKEYMARGESN